MIVLDKTPFYGESGGQVGDRGLLTGDSVRFEVADTRKSGNAFLHFGTLAQGSLAIGDRLSAGLMLTAGEQHSKITLPHICCMQA